MKFKRGDSFDFTGPVTITVDGTVLADATGYTATSQVRDEDGTLIADLVATFTSYAPPILNVKCEDPTQEWPPGKANIDIEFLTPDDKIASTGTQQFTILSDVTRAA
jgi:hypothetical protein